MTYERCRVFALLASVATVAVALVHGGPAGWLAAAVAAGAGLAVFGHHRWGPFLLLAASFLAYLGADVPTGVALMVAAMLLLGIAGKG